MGYAISVLFKPHCLAWRHLFSLSTKKNVFLNKAVLNINGLTDAASFLYLFPYCTLIWSMTPMVTWPNYVIKKVSMWVISLCYSSAISVAASLINGLVVVSVRSWIRFELYAGADIKKHALNRGVHYEWASAYYRAVSFCNFLSSFCLHGYIPLSSLSCIEALPAPCRGTEEPPILCIACRMTEELPT